jgi:hypothetical protein
MFNFKSGEYGEASGANTGFEAVNNYAVAIAFYNIGMVCIGLANYIKSKVITHNHGIQQGNNNPKPMNSSQDTSSDSQDTSTDITACLHDNVPDNSHSDC